MRSKGFTIVELLIVIVVIAILAAISIVAYRGIQDRAHNTTVQSDLRNVASKIELYRAENATYPRNLSDALRSDPLYAVSASREAYPDNGYNLVYCTKDSARRAASRGVV